MSERILRNNSKIQILKKIAQNSSKYEHRLFTQTMNFCPRIIAMMLVVLGVFCILFLYENKEDCTVIGGKFARKSEFSTQVFSGLHPIYHDDD